MVIAVSGGSLPLLEGARGKGRLRPRFIEKTLANIAHTFETMVYAEEIARRPGLWQRLDSLVKIVVSLILILAVALAHEVAAIFALYLLVLALASFSRIPLVPFIKRVWLLVALFTLLIALPAIFNWFTPGKPLITLWDWGRPWSWWIFSLPSSLSITQPGLMVAGRLVLRVATSVSLATVLVLTTPWWNLMVGLRALHVPQVFIAILGMTYRYLFLLLRSANDLFVARKSRTVGWLDGGEERRWVAAATATLLAKSYHLCQEVSLAMISRGFRGEVVMSEKSSLVREDWLWGGASLIIAFGVLLGERWL